jgi:choline dehydrogenase
MQAVGAAPGAVRAAASYTRSGMSEAGQFDYIVIGAGSAGCAIASRLSEDPTKRVALIEAGPRDTNIWIHIPVGYYRNIFNPKVAWYFETAPEPSVNGRAIPWPRGRVLGGTSAINGLVYIRGQKEDYDHWRQLGNVGWSYDDVLPYFKKAEDNQSLDDAFHGRGGPLGVTTAEQGHELMEAFIRAAEEIGIPRTKDFNGASQEGAGYYQLTTKNGRRSTTAVAYLRPAVKRGNLEVVTEALVERVLLDGKRARGLQFRRHGSSETIRTSGEIIVSAGAIGSPHILQLSGIGPGELLRSKGIAVAHELAGVGRNMQDHLQIRSLYKCTKPITLNDIVNNPLRKIGIGIEYLLKRTGPMTIGAGHVGIFARTQRHMATPDVQFHVINFSADKPGDGLHPFSGFISSVCQLRPESRGFLEITSSDPAAKPRIVPNYLATETDRRTMVDGLKLARRLAATRALGPYIAEELQPGPKVQSDAELLEDIRNRSTTVFHPCATCMMAPASNALGVVDERLNVRGLEALRVADASIMPAVVSGNTNAGSIMIGEKAADMIRQDARAR